MAEFEEKLNSILSDPDAMSRIMQLAESLGGGTADQTPQAAAPAADSSKPSAEAFSGLDPQLIGKFLPLLRELGSTRNSNARTLLLALRPYLKPERQNKVERAIQLAHLLHTGKAFLAGWGKSNHV